MEEYYISTNIKEEVIRDDRDNEIHCFSYDLTEYTKDELVRMKAKLIRYYSQEKRNNSLTYATGDYIQFLNFFLQ